MSLFFSFPKIDHDRVVAAIGVGGNRVELFDPGALDRAELERIEAWVARIKAALEGDDFHLDF